MPPIILSEKDNRLCHRITEIKKLLSIMNYPLLIQPALIYVIDSEVTSSVST